MILRIIFFSTTPDALAKGKQVWDSEMAPLLSKQEGFIKAYRADADDEPAGGVMVQVWKSKEAEDAWRSSAEYLSVLRKMEAHFPELRIGRDFVVDKEL